MHDGKLRERSVTDVGTVLGVHECVSCCSVKIVSVCNLLQREDSPSEEISRLRAELEESLDPNGNKDDDIILAEYFSDEESKKEEER